MLESKFTSRLLTTLRAKIPEAVVLKHSDRFTGGIPDFSITIDGATTWFEVKIAPNTTTTIQWETLRRLKRAYVVIYDDGWKLGVVFQAIGAAQPNVNDFAPQGFGLLVKEIERIARLR
jgi:hypothetical protein